MGRCRGEWSLTSSESQIGEEQSNCTSIQCFDDKCTSFIGLMKTGSQCQKGLSHVVNEAFRADWQMSAI
jgi:hypothetical protein